MLILVFTAGILTLLCLFLHYSQHFRCSCISSQRTTKQFVPSPSARQLSSINNHASNSTRARNISAISMVDSLNKQMQTLKRPKVCHDILYMYSVCNRQFQIKSYHKHKYTYYMSHTEMLSKMFYSNRW